MIFTPLKTFVPLYSVIIKKKQLLSSVQSAAKSPFMLSAALSPALWSFLWKERFVQFPNGTGFAFLNSEMKK
jgi:hypothetical protein